MANLGSGHIQLRILTSMVDGMQRTVREVTDRVGYTRPTIHQSIHGAYSITSGGRNLISTNNEKTTSTTRYGL